MADLSFVIKAIDDFSKTFDKVESKASQIASAAGAVGKGMLAAGAATGVGLGVAIKYASNFEKGMSRVGALSNASEADMAKMTKAAKELGSSTAFSATEASEGMSFLAMSGFKTSEIISAMPGLLSAAAAGQTDLATTADITSNILSGFGIAASDTARVADVLTKTFTSSNTDLGMLGETMKYVAPTAKAMGISLEEVSAAAGILGNAGIQGSQAGTSLSMSLTRLASPAKEAADLMDDLGFNAFDAKGKMLPLHKIIGNLEKSTSGLTDEQRMHAISTIFGAESMKSILTLMESGSGTLLDYTKELENSGGVADEVANKQLDNLSGQLTLLMSAVEGAAISIGEALLPAMKFLVRGVQWVINAFNNLPEGVKKAIAIGTALAAVLTIIGGAALVLVGFIPTIMAGMSAVAGIFGTTAGVLGLVAIKVVAVIAVVAALVAGFIWAWKNVDWFRNGILKAWEMIQAGVKIAVDKVVQLFKMLVSVASRYLSELYQSVAPTLDSIASKVSAAFSFVKDVSMAVWGWIGDKIPGIVDQVRGIIATAMPILQTIMSVAWTVIKYLILSTWTAITNIIQGGLKFIDGLITFFGGLFTGNFSQMWEGIKSMFFGAIQLIWGIINVLFVGRILKAGALLAKGLMAALRAMWNFLRNLFVKSASSIWQTIVKVFNGIRGTISTVTNGIRNIIRSGWNFLRNLTSNTFGTIWNVIRSIFSGIRNTISTAISGVRNTISTGFNAALSTVRSILGTMRSTISNLFNRFRSTIRSVMSGIKNVIKSGWNGALSFLRGINLASIGKNIIQGLINGIKSKIKAVGSAIKGIASTITGGITNALSIHSPSRVMRDLGIFTGQGLAIGMEKMVGAVGKSSDKMAMAAVPDVSAIQAPKFEAVRRTGGNVSNVTTKQQKSDAATQQKAEYFFEVPVVVDGREIARATARFTKDELDRMERQKSRAKGETL